jgi:hypothetical protein
MASESPQKSNLPQRIREAVGSGEFSKARLLWEEYGAAFRADRLCGPLPQSRLVEARELAEWTRMAALCTRAHAQAKLNRIAVAQKYGWPKPHSHATLLARL